MIGKWAPYVLAKVGDRITFRISFPVPFECGVFEGKIVAHLEDNEFMVEREDEYGVRYVVKQLSPTQFEGGQSSRFAAEGIDK